MADGPQVDGSGRAVEAAAGAARRLILFGGVVERSPLLRALVALLDGLVAVPGGAAPAGGPPGAHWGRAAALAREVLQGRLAGPAAQASGAPGGSEQPVSPWFAAVVHGLLADENPFTETVARTEAGELRALEGLAPSLLAAAEHDLRSLQVLAALRGEALEAEVRRREPVWPPGVLTGLWHGESPAGGPWPEGAARVHQRLACLEDWAEALPDLVAYWRRAGSGPLGQYLAFRWEEVAGESGAGPALQPVRSPDPTRLEDLVGYEAAREAVVENTERLVSGRPAHHLLLYGPRGTGKSATVRALVHTFGSRGLRLVELPLGRVGELPGLLKLLRNRPQRFVILLDDLSLEPHDPAARELKVALEGTLEVWPENVRLYATSNRRHLVRESRTGPAFRQEDEIHEQISLADRFGMTILFQAADQELYLRIVEGLAEKAGVQIVEGGHEPAPQGGRLPKASAASGDRSGPPWVIDRQTLAREALQWALRNNERSPRTAAQFVRDWVGRTG